MKVAPAEHRPWPVPPRCPVMRMVWHDLLFAHWPIEPEAMALLLPSPLRPDTFDGRAWVGVVPFRMSGVAAWGLPALPVASAFCELNVRTYVTVEGKPGVYFFSLDAASPLAVRAARVGFGLPYMDARMSLHREGETVRYTSVRTHRNEPAARFDATYAPTGPVFQARPGTLEHFLTERYCLYTVHPRRGVRRGEIHHAPWPLQPATAEVRINTMAAAAGLMLPGVPPHLLYAHRLEVPAWWPERVGVGAPRDGRAVSP